MAEAATNQGRVGDLIEIRVLQAIVFKHAGNPVAVLAAFLNALGLGEPGGYVRVFVNEQDEILPLLRRAARFSAHAHYARRLIDASRWANASDRGPGSNAATLLSTREAEVLRLVAVGQSNVEIANSLFISQATVKRHLSTIFRKLAVTNRTGAVEHARQHHML